MDLQVKALMAAAVELNKRAAIDKEQARNDALLTFEKPGEDTNFATKANIDLKDLTFSIDSVGPPVQGVGKATRIQWRKLEKQDLTKNIPTVHMTIEQVDNLLLYAELLMRSRKFPFGIKVNQVVDSYLVINTCIPCQNSKL